MYSETDVVCAVEVCEEGDVCLVGSNIEGGGRVELCLGNEWRSVGDETWGIEEASVVCRQLQLPAMNGSFHYIQCIVTITNYSTYSEVQFGWDLSSTAGVGIRCSGNESTLFNCTLYDVENYSCYGGATTIACLAVG